MDEIKKIIEELCEKLGAAEKKHGVYTTLRREGNNGRPGAVEYSIHPKASPIIWECSDYDK